MTKEHVFKHTTKNLRKTINSLTTAIMATSFAMKHLGTITHVEIADAVALTFDDGPHPEYTPRLLEILEKHDVRATFFMVGELAQQHPEIVKQVAKAGHAIGNHSWSHLSFPFISGREQRKQIRACKKAIAPYGQPILRPPYGHQNAISALNAFLLRYKVVTWSAHAEDWLGHDANWMADRLEERAQPGKIILLHDGLFDAIRSDYFDRTQTLATVDLLLESLKDRFRFLTVPELLKEGKPQRQSWFLMLGERKLKNFLKQMNKLTYRNGEKRRYSKDSWNRWLALQPEQMNKKRGT